MKTRWLLAAATAAMAAQSAAMLAACANEGEAEIEPPAERDTPIPAVDGSSEAVDAGDASTCKVDCEFYPDECTEDALCTGGPFAPETAGGALDLRTHVNALVARAPNDVWLAGTVGGIAHFDGISWTRSVVGTKHSLYGLWLLQGAEVAFDDPRRLYTRGVEVDADASVSSDGWSFFGSATLPAPWGNQSTTRIVATWAHPDALSMWIGTATVFDRAGGLWRLRYSPVDGKFVLAAMAPDCSRVPCQYVSAIGGVSADKIWAVGPKGAAFRVTDAESDTPTLTGFNSQTIHALHGVWAAASDDVWMVGSTGTVRRYRGDARFLETYDEVGSKQHFNAIAGTSSSDIWIAGDEGTVLHYDGNAWKRMKVAGLGARRPRLDRIWTPSPGKAWIAGQGTLLSLGGKP